VNTSSAADKAAVKDQSSKPFDTCAGSDTEETKSSSKVVSGTVTAAKGEYDKEEKKVKACAAKQATVEQPAKDCEEVVKTLKGAARTDCHEGTKEKDNDISMCSILKTHRTKTDWLESVLEWFEKQDKKYTEISTNCKADKGNLTKERKKCNEIKKNTEQKKDSCTVHEEKRELAACEVKTAMASMCAKYDACYKAAVSSYDVLVNVTKTRVTERKLQWRMLKRLDCLVQAYDKKGIDKAKLDKCTGKGKDALKTDFLTIDFPKVPGKKPCESKPSPKMSKECPDPTKKKKKEEASESTPSAL